MSIEPAIKAIKRAAEISISLGDPKWCELLSITFRNGCGEVIEALHISGTAALTNESSKLVRVDLNFEDLICASPIRNAIRMALCPLIVCGRKFCAGSFPRELPQLICRVPDLTAV